MAISSQRPYFARRGGSPSLRAPERRDIGLTRSGADSGTSAVHRPQPRFEVIIGTGSDSQGAIAPQQLTITRRTKADEVTLILRGELDLASAPALERELNDIEASQPRLIVLDLGALEFIGSTGIHLLVEADRRAQTRAHHFVLRHVPTHARRLLHLTGADALITVE